ncbi:M16 family metallopeptidase [Streptomyces sp. NRRL F-5650]|uniref:M16 family metallopeptidase n=1 Tax=Streptomyces sp. NRRL F-5650 TaxID=1463868 RepID=UPI0004CB9392|nr:pitrilysin family protein [Streptomyces sp. NRRL F-5650]
MRRLTLDNGLRVVLDARAAAPVVGVAVHYGVGFRSEPVDRGGFAHLFEHLMFQGSARVAAGEHFSHVQRSGGTAGGSTHQDYTDFYEIAPAAALERLLFLEADRMAGLRLTQHALDTQRRVVGEEILTNVTNRPYGGFPWTVLPGVLYSSYANAHNGYGDLSDLARATLPDCVAFHREHYLPDNAVLTVSGGFDDRRAEDLVVRYFGAIPAGTGAPAASLAEPLPSTVLRGTYEDANAPLPALALGHRMPDPVSELPAYVAFMVLSTLLTGTDQCALSRRLLTETRLATAVRSGCGSFGPLQARDPDTFQFVVTHFPQAAVEDVVAETDDVLRDLARRGPGPAELTSAAARLRASTARGYDSLLTRTRHLGAFELLHGQPGLVDRLPSLVDAVGADDVAAAAGRLLAHPRAVLCLRTRQGAGV